MKEKSNVIGDVEIKDIKLLKKFIRNYIVLVVTSDMNKSNIDDIVHMFHYNSFNRILVYQL